MTRSTASCTRPAGTTAPSIIPNLYAYDPASDTWTQLASMTGAREKPAAAAIDGLLYVTGGWDEFGTPDPTLEIYDPSSDSWSTGASVPTAYAAAAPVVRRRPDVRHRRLHLFLRCDRRLPLRPGRRQLGHRGLVPRARLLDPLREHRRVDLLRRWCHRSCSNGDGTSTTPAPTAGAISPTSRTTRWAGGFVSANGQLLVSGA